MRAVGRANQEQLSCSSCKHLLRETSQLRYALNEQKKENTKQHYEILKLKELSNANKSRYSQLNGEIIMANVECQRMLSAAQEESKANEKQTVDLKIQLANVQSQHNNLKELIAQLTSENAFLRAQQIETNSLLREAIKHEKCKNCLPILQDATSLETKHVDTPPSELPTKDNDNTPEPSNKVKASNKRITKKRTTMCSTQKARNSNNKENSSSNCDKTRTTNETKRRKRKSTSGRIVYTEPSLAAKLRKGDAFTFGN